MTTSVATPTVTPLSNELIIASVHTLLAAARLHSSTEKSIALAILGTIHSPRLGVTPIGTALAQVTGHSPKHGVKQVDRLMSNDNFRLPDCFRAYVRAVIGNRRLIVTALDWTEFAPDGQATICLYMVTRHGRATPLVWKTVDASALKDCRNSFEDELLRLFKDSLPKENPPGVIVLADRGFGDVALYSELEEELGFHFAIRFRKNVLVEHNGVRKRADEWLAEAGGRSLQLRRPKLTGHFKEVASFVAVHAPEMKEPWFLATSLPGGIKATTTLYSRRFTIEETFRDQKDIRFGWGLYDTIVTQPVRRDRLLFLAAVTQLLLTLVGAAGEALGLDAMLRVNTETRRRTHSLLRQGREYIKGLVERVAQQLQERFLQFLNTLTSTTDTYAIV
jgi:hypothetical protein